MPNYLPKAQNTLKQRDSEEALLGHITSFIADSSRAPSCIHVAISVRSSVTHILHKTRRPTSSPFPFISLSESRSCCQRHAAAILRPKIYSQCNIYEARAKKKTYEFYTEKAAYKEEQRSGTIVSEGDMLLTETYYPTWTMESADHSLGEILQLCSGWQSIAKSKELVPN
ncbi:hypothetical protein PIB30_016202 [Stylosanthes scabra]|uniref:Uncharacterized protein n=1 Tax=Stylosanthes scabra TaxID=79078 RepID=A0ABU6V6A1_9FABA|nr:hypothetical protein [Stylosanthes scabra]